MPLSRFLAILAALAAVTGGPAAAQEAPWKPFAEVTSGADAATSLLPMARAQETIAAADQAAGRRERAPRRAL